MWGPPATCTVLTHSALLQVCDFTPQLESVQQTTFPAYPVAKPSVPGFRRLGFGLLVSSLAVPFIHGSFSYPTCPTILPDPFMRLYQKNMHRSKHGSDSGRGKGAHSLQRSTL